MRITKVQICTATGVLTYRESGESTTQMIKGQPEKYNSGCPSCGSNEYKSRTRSRYACTTCVCGKEYFHCPVHDKEHLGLPAKHWTEIDGKRYEVQTVDSNGCCCPANIATAMYEDRKRKQPRDLSDFDQGNPAQAPDIVVETKRSNSKPYNEKYKGSKSKVSTNVWRTNDVGTVPAIPRSKILL